MLPLLLDVNIDLLLFLLVELFVLVVGAVAARLHTAAVVMSVLFWVFGVSRQLECLFSNLLGGGGHLILVHTLDSGALILAGRLLDRLVLILQCACTFPIVFVYAALDSAFCFRWRRLLILLLRS